MSTTNETAKAIREYVVRGSYAAAVRAALEALEAVGASMIIHQGSGKPCPFGSARRGHYRFTLKSESGRYSSDYWHSIAGTEAGEFPTAYDMLSCLQWYMDSDNAADFGSTLGYTNGKEAMRAYKACKRQAEALARILTADQRKVLSQIA